MKRGLLTIGMICCLVAVIYFIRPGDGNKSAEVKDLSSLTGIYEGEATVVLSDYLREMAAATYAGSEELIPKEAVPCKVAVKVTENNELLMELVDFEIPVEGINLEPARCTVTRDSAAYHLEGKGNVVYEKQTFNYSHKGKIQDGELNLDLTLVVVPLVAEPKVVFKGRKI